MALIPDEWLDVAILGGSLLTLMGLGIAIILDPPMKVVAGVLLYPETEADCIMLKDKIIRFVDQDEVRALRHIRVGVGRFAEVLYQGQKYYVPLTYDIKKIIGDGR